MPLSHCQTWTGTFTTTKPTKKRSTLSVNKTPRKATSFGAHHLVGILGATAIGGFFAGVPVVGAMAGAAGTTVILSMFVRWPSERSPSSPKALPARPQDALLLGADGLCVAGKFEPWFRVRSVSFHDYVTVSFCDGRKWYFQAYGAPLIAEQARRRMRWALDGRTPYVLSPSSYRVAGRCRYNEALGLPVALRADRTMDERVEDYRGLDADVQVRVLRSTADPPTRIAFAQVRRSESAPTG
ncbi:MAG: hypothetical protein AB8H86_19425 [Polyangiales bacterium]